MTLRNTGDKGEIAVKDDGAFLWNLAKKPVAGTFRDNTLLLHNEQESLPKWMEYLEFRHTDAATATEMIEFALRQSTLRQRADESQTARRQSTEKGVINNLQKLVAAVDQYYLEHKTDIVTFADIVGTGKSIQSLQPVDGEDYAKLDLRKGTAPWELKTTSGLVVRFNH